MTLELYTCIHEETMCKQHSLIYVYYDDSGHYNYKEDEVIFAEIVYCFVISAKDVCYLNKLLLFHLDIMTIHCLNCQFLFLKIA